MTERITRLVAACPRALGARLLPAEHTRTGQYGETTVEPFRTDCAEFPNDNPALHEGAVWVCRIPTGRPRAILRALVARETPPAFAREASSPAEPVSTPSVAEPPDPWEELVAQVVEVALEVGATRAAAVAPELLAGTGIDPDRLLASGRAASIAHGVLELRNGVLVLSERERASADTWRAVLRGQSDLGTCETTLDTWCAGLLALISGTPGRSDELRRALRRRGVAAFGLLQAA
jgi:hypothetical protein